MIWVLAAAPLWVTGFACIACAFYCISHKKQDETGADLVFQFAFYMFLSLFLLYLAARMST